MRPLTREYLRLGFVSWIPAIVSIAGMFLGGDSGGSSGGNVPGASTYVPTGQASADTTWQSVMSQLFNTAQGQAGTLTPYLNSAFGSTNDLYTQLAERMKGYGGQLGTAGSDMLGRSGDLYSAGSQMWRDAQDPEHALHDRTQQQIVDASRAATSARGIGMSGASAGLEDQAVSNFNIDWNDRQLGREATGMQGLTSAYDAGGRQNLGGMSLLNDSTAMFKGAGALPFQLSDMFSQSMQGGVYDPMRNLLGNLQSYMGLGQSATAQSFGQQQTNMNNLTSSLSNIDWNAISQAFTPASSGSGASSTVDDTTWGGA